MPEPPGGSCSHSPLHLTAGAQGFRGPQLQLTWAQGEESRGLLLLRARQREGCFPLGCLSRRQGRGLSEKSWIAQLQVAGQRMAPGQVEQDLEG